MPLTILILAAGMGSRMNSSRPKVLQKLAGKPLIDHVLNATSELDADQTILVHGYLGDMVLDSLKDRSNLIFVEQKKRLGTGHAVMEALPMINKGNKVLILYGDVPMISSRTLGHLEKMVHTSNIGILTAKVEQPYGLGRIIRNSYNEVESIIEEKDATELQKQINEINTGIYCVNEEHLSRWLPKLKTNNNQKEYYLTDIVKLAKDENIDISVAQPLDIFEVLGVNNRAELSKLERLYHRAKVENIMSDGVSIADTARIDIRGNLNVGQDSWLDINTLFEGDNEIGANCEIGANVIIINSIIRDNVIVKANSIIENSIIESNVTVGPFARIRPNTQIKSGARIGNFVEIKASTIGNFSKVNHLSYVGDAEVGEDCNIGAGVITCNYDGVKKYKTKINNRVFVGSNSQLVAPVEIGDSSTVGAGSTITKDIPKNSLAISRSPQRNIEDWPKVKKK